MTMVFLNECRFLLLVVLCPCVDGVAKISDACHGPPSVNLTYNALTCGPGTTIFINEVIYYQFYADDDCPHTLANNLQGANCCRRRENRCSWISTAGNETQELRETCCDHSTCRLHSQVSRVAEHPCRYLGDSVRMNVSSVRSILYTCIPARTSCSVSSCAMLNVDVPIFLEKARKASTASVPANRCSESIKTSQLATTQEETTTKATVTSLLHSTGEDNTSNTAVFAKSAVTSSSVSTTDNHTSTPVKWLKPTGRTTRVPDPENDPSSTKTGIIIGAVVGGLAVIGIIVACLLCMCRRRGRPENHAKASGNVTEMESKQGPLVSVDRKYCSTVDEHGIYETVCENGLPLGQQKDSTLSPGQQEESTNLYLRPKDIQEAQQGYETYRQPSYFLDDMGPNVLEETVVYETVPGEGLLDKQKECSKISSHTHDIEEDDCIKSADPVYIMPDEIREGDYKQKESLALSHLTRGEQETESNITTIDSVYITPDGIKDKDYTIENIKQEPNIAPAEGVCINLKEYASQEISHTDLSDDYLSPVCNHSEAACEQIVMTNLSLNSEHTDNGPTGHEDNWKNENLSGFGSL